MSTRKWMKLLAVALVVMCAGAALGYVLTGVVSASSNPPPAPPEAFALDEVGAASLKWYPCTPSQVGTFDNRVHVRCTVADGNILYFASPTSDSKFAARVLSVMLTAQAAGKHLNILYDPNNLHGATYGCMTGDCREISGINMY